jgi:hypothetical protein
MFLSALKGETIEVTKATFPDFSSLCNEFGFELRTLLIDLDKLNLQLKNVIERLSGGVSAQEGRPGFTAQLSNDIKQHRVDVSVVKSWTSAANSLILSDLHAERLDSLIVSNFPEIFSDFRGKDFKLLWRGSRNGFEVQEFHRRCDGHSNTLTVILDTNGNLFGGFTPLEWESRMWNGNCGETTSGRWMTV